MSGFSITLNSRADRINPIRFSRALSRRQSPVENKDNKNFAAAFGISRYAAAFCCFFKILFYALSSVEAYKSASEYVDDAAETVPGNTARQRMADKHLQIVFILFSPVYYYSY